MKLNMILDEEVHSIPGDMYSSKKKIVHIDTGDSGLEADPSVIAGVLRATADRIDPKVSGIKPGTYTSYNGNGIIGVATGDGNFITSGTIRA